jgi:DNA-binding transcriptional regulator YiaG
MDLGLRQLELADPLGVDRDTIRNWEIGRSRPALRSWPGIIRHLGVRALPCGNGLPHRLMRVRMVTGLSQARLARHIGIDESTLRAWESGRRVPAESGKRWVN